MSYFTEQFTDYDITNYGLVRLPEINIPVEEKRKIGLKDDCSNNEFLIALARNGFKDKKRMIKKDRYKEYGDRVKYELDIFSELGLTDYVLLVWCVIDKARKLDVFIDYGRGSCAGSCVFWFLGITGVDPIDKGLFFERFVSKVRSKKQLIDGNIFLLGNLLADADLNLGDGRDKIVEWLKQIYPNRVCKISNLSTFTSKILIKDVYKCVSEASEDDAKAVSDLIESKFGIVDDLFDCYKDNKEFREWADKNKEVYDIALKLQGLLRQKSIHASGYVISYYDLNEYIPLELNKENEVATACDMHEVCNFVVKLDLLGLTTNKIINSILKNINEDITTIDLDHEPLIYNQFQNNNLLPYGLYQISADCAYRVLNKIKPKDIYELSAVNSIARPGALAYLDDYVDNKKPCPHEVFKDILKTTRNNCLYQEQMMQMLVAVGFTKDEAEIARKIVGKKEVDKVKEWQDKIYNKIKENGFPEDLYNILWKILNDSAKYSFNLSHSLATSYLTCLTVYLKYKYPLQFYLACLNCINDLTDTSEQISLIKNELPHFGIKLLSPDILLSDEKFKTEGNDIRFGLSNIKGISDKIIDKLRLYKKDNSTKFDIFNSASAASLPINVMRALIMSGCINSGNITRSRLVLELELYNILTDKERNYIAVYAAKYNNDLCKLVKECNDSLIDTRGRKLIKDSRFETIKKKFAPFKEKYQINSKHEELCGYIMENEYLGFSYSTTLKTIFSKHCNDLKTIYEISGELNDTKVRLVANVVKVEKKVSKAKKSPYLRMTIKDESGEATAMLFNQQRIDQTNQFNGKEVESGDIVILNCNKKDGGSLFVDTLSIQDSPVIVKLSDLTKSIKL